ncbi:MAG TPA: hypothetical protein VNZ67_06120, partial [bacterium]|nr:hypothetical protein [bacterium]
ALYCAWRIRAGELPYRDFFCNYGPGSFCVNAAVMAALGQGVAVVRSVDLCVRLAVAWSCGWAAHRAGAGRYSTVVFGAALLMLGTINFFGYAGHPGMLLVLGCSLAWLRCLDSGSRAWAAAAGLMAGLALFVRQDFGVYLAVAMALHGSAAAWLGRRPGAWRCLGWAAAAGAAGAAALYAPFLAQAGPGRLWQDLFVGNLPEMNGPYVLALPGFAALRLTWLGLRHLDFTAIEQGQVWAGLYVGGAVLLDLLLLSVPRIRQGRPLALAGLWYALLGCLFLRQGLNRADLIHFYPFILMALIAASLQAGAWSLGRAKWALLVLGLYFVATPAAAWVRYLRGVGSYPSSRLERSAGLPVAADMDAAVALVRRGTRPGERIVVEDASVELGTVNDALFYFLADRPSASYYELVQMPAPAGYGQDLEAALGRSTTAAVVLWDGLRTGPGTGPLDARLRAFGSGPVYGVGDFKMRFIRPLPPLEVPKNPS